MHTMTTFAAAAATGANGNPFLTPKVIMIVLAIAALIIAFKGITVMAGKNETMKSASEKGGVQLIGLAFIVVATMIVGIAAVMGGVFQFILN